jgi:hypothetical protein
MASKYKDGPWHLPGTAKVAPPRMLYFEKCDDGAIVTCEVRVVESFGFAFVSGDDSELSKGFSGKDAEVQAVKYIESMGFTPAVDWKLPPPAK